MNKEGIFEFLHFSHPTKEQTEVLSAMENFVQDDNSLDFLILCGAAGTGKTSLTAALVGYLNNLQRDYRIAAPTGRAARILGRKANTTTSTIHALIYKPIPDEDSGNITFKLKTDPNPDPVVYIIDEASMIQKNVDKEEGIFIVEKGLIFDLISYIKQSNVENKIIFLGDHYQLPPIGENKSYALDKDFLEQTFNLKGLTFMMKEVKRQEDGSYILENATEIRKAIDEGISSYPIRGNRNKNIFAAADRYVKEVKSGGLGNSVALAVSNNANMLFNKLVRERIFKQARKILEPGDLLMVARNWHRNNEYLYNGDHVQLLSVDWDLQEQVAGLHFVAVRIKLLFSDTETEKIIEDYALLETIITPGGKISQKMENDLRRQRYVKNRIFRASSMPGDDRYVGALRLMYGHAITCNKAQGGEWKKVYINTWGIPSLKWQYTAVTRGIEGIETF